MKHRLSSAIVLLSFLLVAQDTPSVPNESHDVRLPSGRMQRDEIVKADHAKNVEDARELVRLAEELRTDLDKQGQFVLSVSLIKKTEEIEKLAKRIRSRMKRM
jgi:hypothetical protein